ncbi:MAG: outer membrane protein transport protein [Deltaproteobacteria bacterium]|nr:outer membrane protein transport protein [Deltaproteobacteria bacterium]
MTRILFVLCFFAASSAQAAGLFLTDRGVRPLSRGGAFVAGADDLSSIWYNPAGLMESGSQLMLDAAYLNVDTSFTRKAYIPVSSTGEPSTQTFDKVSGTAPFMPIPTLAVSHNFGLKTWNFALGMYVPYAALSEYPETVVNANGEEHAAPQRYSLLNPKGTVLGVLGLYVAKSFLDGRLQIGLGPKFLLGEYVSTLALSSCPNATCAEQDPDWDAVNRLTAGFIFTASGSLGAIFKITDQYRLGFSADLPFWVDTPAKIQVRLPRAPLFAGATVEGDQARVKFRLPLILRLGFEMRPVQGLRLELAVVFEGWAIHDKIEILRGKNGVNLNNVIGLPSPYPIGDLTVQRNFRDTFSVRLGGEYGGGGYTFNYRLRAGVNYDRAAIPRDYLSVLTLDVDKVTTSVGVSIGFYGITLDVLYAHVFGINTSVDPQQAKLYAMSPVRAEPIDQTAINGGDYTLQANVIGLGLSYKFGGPK